MQPNEQEPTQPPATTPAQPGGYHDVSAPNPTHERESAPVTQTTSSTPPGTIEPSFATPDFFQLDPIVDPISAENRSRKKKRTLLILVGCLMLIMSISFALYLYAQYNSPQSKFYRVLESQMNIPVVKKTFSISPQNRGASIRAEVTADYSNISNPKGVASITKKGDHSIKYIVESTTPPIIYVNENGKPKQQLSTKNDFKKYDGGVLESLLSPIGVVLIGSVSDRTGIVKDMQDKNVYKIVSSEKDTYRDMPATKYLIKVDNDKLKAINTSLATKLSVIHPSETMDGSLVKNGEIVVWVNDDDYILGISFTTVRGNTNPPSDISVMYDYPSSVKYSLMNNKFTQGVWVV